MKYSDLQIANTSPPRSPIATKPSSAMSRKCSPAHSSIPWSDSKPLRRPIVNIGRSRSTSGCLSILILVNGTAASPFGFSVWYFSHMMDSNHRPVA